MKTLRDVDPLVLTSILALLAIGLGHSLFGSLIRTASRSPL